MSRISVHSPGPNIAPEHKVTPGSLRNIHDPFTVTLEEPEIQMPIQNYSVSIHLERFSLTSDRPNLAENLPWLEPSASMNNHSMRCLFIAVISEIGKPTTCRTNPSLDHS